MHRVTLRLTSVAAQVLVRSVPLAVLDAPFADAGDALAADSPVNRNLGEDGRASPSSGKRSDDAGDTGTRRDDAGDAGKRSDDAGDAGKLSEGARDASTGGKVEEDELAAEDRPGAFPVPQSVGRRRPR